MRFAERHPETAVSLRAELEAHPLKEGIDLYFNAANPIDAGHARHLAGVRGVRLHPQEGSSAHTVLLEMIEDGRFNAVLDDLERL